MTELTFAGHSAVFCNFSGYTVAIDPWLTTNPVCPSSCKNPTALDAIVLTHGHSDHAGDAAELAKRSGAKLLATYELAVLMMEAGVPEAQVVPMNKGGSVDLGSVTVSLTHALHSNSYDSSTGTRYAGEACGVVLKSQDVCIYHAGDTTLFSDMRLIAEAYRPDLALLPIGDRFTMGPAQAAIAAKMLAVSKVIPIHYMTFPMLTGTAEEFAIQLKKQAPNCELLVLEPGQTLKLA